MSTIILTRGALAAGVDALRRQVAQLDDPIGACVAQAGLDVLHAMLCCAEEVEWSAAEAEDVAAEAEEEHLVEETEAEDEQPVEEGEADSPDDAGLEEPWGAPPAPVPPPGAVWSAERLAMLRRDYAFRTKKALHTALNALPGPPIASWGSMAKKASALGITRPRDAREDGPAGAQPVAPPATTLPKLEDFAATEEDLREAEGLVRQSPDQWHGRALAREYGWPIAFAGAFAERVRGAVAQERADG